MTALRQAVPTHPAARPRDGDAVYALRNVSKAFGRGAIRALDHVLGCGLPAGCSTPPTGRTSPNCASATWRRAA